MWKIFETPEVQRYLAAHADDDVAALALGAFPFDAALRPLIIDQIKARQKAREKLPSWGAVPGLVFPPSALLEQASSEATALYKAALAGRGAHFVDLTAGMGVDAAAIAQGFGTAICVEADAHAAGLLRHNLPLLLDRPVEVIHARAEEYVSAMPVCDLAFIDPQRRHQAGRKGLYRIADCQPDVTALLPMLAGKAGRVMLKASPMLDIAEGIAALPGTTEIHVVETQAQCRELLFLITPGTETPTADIPIHCVTLDWSGAVSHDFTFTRGQEQVADAPQGLPCAYIFEPGPAVMKGGGFSVVAQRFGLTKLHSQTHLYTADRWVDGFPGRAFRLIAVLEADRKAMQTAIPGGQAHLKLRNFPGDAAALQKKLGLAEGGDDQLFACTLVNGKRAILQTRRVYGPT